MVSGFDVATSANRDFAKVCPATRRRRKSPSVMIPSRRSGAHYGHAKTAFGHVSKRVLNGGISVNKWQILCPHFIAHMGEQTPPQCPTRMGRGKISFLKAAHFH
jgi:hypothetical protein